MPAIQFPGYPLAHASFLALSSPGYVSRTVAQPFKTCIRKTNTTYLMLVVRIQCVCVCVCVSPCHSAKGDMRKYLLIKVAQAGQSYEGWGCESTLISVVAGVWGALRASEEQ